MTDDTVTIGITAQSTDRSMPLLDLATATAERGVRGPVRVRTHAHARRSHQLAARRRGPVHQPPVGPVHRAVVRRRHHRSGHRHRRGAPGATRPHRAGQGGGHPGQAERRTAHARLRLGLEPRGGGEPRLPTGGACRSHGRKTGADEVTVDGRGNRLRRHLSARGAQLVPSQAAPEAPPSHPPGRAGQRANFARIAAWADGWIPHASPLLEPGFPAQLDEARETWQGAGHDPDRFDVTIMQLPETTDRLAQALENARALGVRACCSWSPKPTAPPPCASSTSWRHCSPERPARPPAQRRALGRPRWRSAMLFRLISEVPP